jgi:PAS domain S-box-containing protein
MTPAPHTTALPRVATVPGTALVFGLLAYLGMSLTRDTMLVAAVWLPNAVLAAVLLRSDRFDLRMLAAAFAANIVAGLAVGDAATRAVALSTVNSFEVALVYLGMRHLGRVRPHMESKRDLLTFCLVGGLFAPILAGALAAVLLSPTGRFDFHLWLGWSLTDSLGMLILAPAVWIALDTWEGRIIPANAGWLEWVAVLGITVAATVLIFTQSRFPVLFVATPFVLLAAFRLGALGSAAATILIAAIAWLATERGTGPMALVRGDMSDRLHVLQGFLAVSFFMSLPVTAALARRDTISEQLRASEALNRSMLDNMREVVFKTDAVGRWVFLNPAWVQLTGFTVEESLGWLTTRLLHPDDLEAARRTYPDLVTGKLLECSLQQRFRRKSGDWAFIEVSVRALRSPDGAFVGTTGNIRDVTESVLAQQRLLERDGQLSLLAQNATDAVFRLTLAGHCIYASPSAERLLGLDPRLMVGAHMLDRFHPDDRDEAEAAFRSMAQGKLETRIVAYRSELVRQPGTFRWLEAHLGLVRDPASREPVEVIASIRDISKTKALEEELRVASARAEHAANAKAAFLANMSHEIRTPMNGVIGFTDLLTTSELKPEQRRYVDMIAESGRAMMRLLNDILDVSKIEAGQMLIADEPLDLPHLLRSATRLMEPVSSAKGLVLDLEIDASVPPLVSGDPLRLRQILLNLVGNAVKFTLHGRVLVRARVLAGNQLRLDVEDSGVGIDAAQLPAIFDKFAQADVSIARRFGGTGLGLSITSQLVQLMGGRIEVASEVGRGTTFSVYLPLKLPQDVPVPAKRSPQSAPTPWSGSRRPRILVAEDHDINQELVLAITARLGVDAKIAPDGEHAIAMIVAARQSGAPFDLVLMDMQMPNIDGLEATRRLRDAGFDARELPIVALTANAYADDIGACVSAGMQHHLSKPVSAQDLAAVLHRFLPSHIDTGAEAPPAAAAPSLDERYRARRDQLMADAHRLVGLADIPDPDLALLCSDLHKFAGVAGSFGDGELGEAAGNLETALEALPSGERAAAIRAWLEGLTTVHDAV